MKSVLFKSLLVSMTSVVLTYALILTVIPIMGEPVTPAALVLGFVCPPLVALPVSAAVFRTNDRLREMHDQLVEAHRQLEHKASHDQMTGLLNRETFLARMAQKHERSERGVLLIADVDHFKSINDTYGHLNGDQALVMIAAVIKNSVRDQDMVGRIGGEEFAAYLDGATLHEAKVVSERMRRSVESLQFTTSCGVRVPVTLSAGGATTDAAASVTDLLRLADENLYDAKESGRNRILFHADYKQVA